MQKLRAGKLEPLMGTSEKNKKSPLPHGNGLGEGGLKNFHSPQSNFFKSVAVPQTPNRSRARIEFPFQGLSSTGKFRALREALGNPPILL